MILIGGENIEVSNLPFPELLDYMVEDSVGILNIKLKTVAKKDDCYGVYIDRALKDKGVKPPASLDDKLYYYTDFKELSELLQSQNQTESAPTLEDVEVEEPKEEITVFSDTTVSVNDTKIVQPKQGTKGEIFLQQVQDEDVEDFFIDVSTLTENTDSLKQQLEVKNKIIAQKDLHSKELHQKINEIYDAQEASMLELKQEHDSIISKANETIKSLKEKVEALTTTKEEKDFMKFYSYSKEYKAVLQEGFSKREGAQAGITENNTPLIFASAGGDSIHKMLENVKDLINSGSDSVIVDFTNDYYIGGSLGIKNKVTSLMLMDSSNKIESLVHKHKNADIIQSSSFNDIAFLHMDWLDILKRIVAYAGNRQVILLFNNVGGFNVRYTVSRLATIGRLHIFAKCNPLILTNLYLDVNFIPTGRFKIVATDYIDIVKDSLKQLANKYPVSAVKEKVTWSKLGIK